MLTVVADAGLKLYLGLHCAIVVNTLRSRRHSTACRTQTNPWFSSTVAQRKWCPPIKYVYELNQYLDGHRNPAAFEGNRTGATYSDHTDYLDKKL